MTVLHGDSKNGWCRSNRTRDVKIVKAACRGEDRDMEKNTGQSYMRFLQLCFMH